MINKEHIEQFEEEYIDSITHPGVDCEEIADDLIQYLKGKNINAQKLRIEPENFNEFLLNLTILEWGEPKEYSYHCVVLVQDTVIDMRNPPFFISLDEYKEKINNLNKNTKIKYKIE